MKVACYPHKNIEGTISKSKSLVTPQYYVPSVGWFLHRSISFA